MNCSAAGFGPPSFLDVHTLEGWWTDKSAFAAAPAALTMGKCYRGSGGQSMCLPSRDGNRCEKGMTGPLCASCEEGWAKQTNRMCLRCEAKIGVIAVCIIVFVGICVIAVLLRRFAPHNTMVLQQKFTKAVARLGSCNVKGKTIATRARRISGQGETLLRSMMSLDSRKRMKYEKLKMKGTILVGLIQVLSQFASEFNVHWNTRFLAVSDSSSWINLDFFRWSSLACTAFGTNFYERFIFSFWMPVLLGLVAFLVPRVAEDTWLFKCVSPPWRSQIVDFAKQFFPSRSTVESRYLGYIFLIYPGLAARVVQMSRCRELVDGNNYLIADMTLDCDKSAVLTSHVRLAWIVYIIGIPVFSVFYIWWERKMTFGGTLYDSSDAMKKEVEESIVGKLYGSYTRTCWWFEGLDLLRNFCMTSVVLYFEHEPHTMYALTLLLAVGFMNLYSNIRPYEDEHDNLFQSCCLTSITLVAFCALAAKVAEELDDWNNISLFQVIDLWTLLSLFQVIDLWTLVAIFHLLLLVSNSSAASVWG
jgi:hypothetical protein